MKQNIKKSNQALRERERERERPDIFNNKLNL